MAFINRFHALFNIDDSDAEQSQGNKTNTGDRDKSELQDKLKEFVENTTEEIKEQSSFLWNELKEKAEQLNESTKEYREKLATAAKDAVEKLDEFIDNTIEKAHQLEQKEKEIDTDQDGIADKQIDFNKSSESNQDEFFNKANKWLEDHQNKKHPSEIPTQINSGNKVIQPLELPKEPEDTI
jgi:DNA repair exonuclease SbcCD ATPase subunit